MVQLLKFLMPFLSSQKKNLKKLCGNNTWRGLSFNLRQMTTNLAIIEKKSKQKKNF